MEKPYSSLVGENDCVSEVPNKINETVRIATVHKNNYKNNDTYQSR